MLQTMGSRSRVRQELERLVKAGLKIAVLSDFHVEDKLAALGLDDLPWAALVASESEGALKPHPRSFAAVASALDLRAEQIVHVGDRADTDVLGAKEAGMRALLVGKPPTALTFTAAVDEILALAKAPS